MLVLLRGIKRDNLTVHGLRSTFRDRPAERASFRNAASEMALARAIGDGTSADGCPHHRARARLRG